MCASVSLCAENDYRSDAFTSSHIQLLQLLCSQAALSIDNARLYAALSEYNASLEQQVHVRTGELEQKHAQLSLAKEAAEAATKAKADFLSNMSHEIRTPMNAVLGVGRLLADTPLTLEQQQLVSMITNSGQLLLTIINDILDYSKIEAGQLNLNYSSQNVNEVLESAVLLCYDMAASKGLELSWFVEPSLPVALTVDATRLQQVLLNMLSNAIKFTKVGGVDVELCGHVLPTEGDSDPHADARVQLNCKVKDTGIGISPAQLATLFKSFSQ
jgi:signal transduction histidine kinase